MNDSLGPREEQTTRGLFRDAARPRRILEPGTPIVAMPIPWRFLTILTAAFFICILLFVCTQTITRRESARGILALSLGEIRVIPPRPGIITALYVKDGQEVLEGQRLAYISTAQLLINGGGVEAQLLKAISQEREALRAQLTALDQSAPTEHRGQEQHLLAERQKLSQLMELLPKSIAHRNLAQETYIDGQRLESQGTITGDSLRQRHYEWLAQEAETENVQTQISDLQGHIASDVAALSELPQQQSKQHQEIVSQLAALDEKESTTAGQEGFLIAARVAGHVTALQARAGQYVDSTKPLMTLTPRGSVLQAELYVPSKAIGFLKKGERVRLLYDAFPYEQFGLSYGTVGQISSTVLKPDEVGAAVSIKEPAYQIIVQPDRATVRAYGSDVPLRSGMAVTGDVVLEDRSILRLLLDPLFAARGRILGGEADIAR